MIHYHVYMERMNNIYQGQFSEFKTVFESTLLDCKANIENAIYADFWLPNFMNIEIWNLKFHDTRTMTHTHTLFILNQKEITLQIA